MAPPSTTDVNLKQIFTEFFSLEHRQKTDRLLIDRKPMVELLPLIPLNQRQRATELSSQMPSCAQQNPSAEANPNPEAKIDPVAAAITNSAKIDAVEKQSITNSAKIDAVEKQSPAIINSEGAKESALKPTTTNAESAAAKIRIYAIKAITKIRIYAVKAITKIRIYAIKAIMKGAEAEVMIDAVKAAIANLEGAEAKDTISAVEAITKAMGKLLAAAAKAKDDAASNLEAEAKEKMDAVEKELSKIVGLDALKMQIKEWVKGRYLDESRRVLCLEVGSKRLPHMAFDGNPGTGKTSVARKLGKLFHMVGILPTSKVIEVQIEELVGHYVNNTVQKTKAKIQEAEGGILFLHEGYSTKSFFDLAKKEAAEDMRAAMDSGKVVVIFAGNNEAMEHSVSSSAGVKKRLTNFFHFDDFTCEDLAKVLHVKLSNADENSIFYGFKLHASCSVEVVTAMIELETTEKQRNEMNGRLVDQMLRKAIENLDSRVGLNCKDTTSLLTITSEDLQAALSSLSLIAKGKEQKSENPCRNVKAEMDALESVEEKKMDVKAKMDVLKSELSKMVGMDALKLQLEKWLKGMIVDERCRTVGLDVGSRRMPHMVFLGNPGTGKTMVARVLAKLLHMVGIIPTDKVIEVQRTDLVAQHIGDTGPKTREKIQAAEGGILFVDEAYQLVVESSHNDFGLQALEEIMSSMDSGSIVVIFAGYSGPMKRVISSNKGFKRRVSMVFNFDDYSCQDLAKIAHLKMSNQPKTSLFYGFKLHPECTVEAIAALIERETTQAERKEFNGGLVDRMLVNARENFDSRIDVESIDAHFELTITLDDLAVGINDERKGWLEEDTSSHFCSWYI